MNFPAGSVIVRGRPDIVELVVSVATADEPYHLRALYLGKRFATEWTADDLDDARLATGADHEQAKRYAERFNSAEEPFEFAPKTGGQLDLFARTG